MDKLIWMNIPAARPRSGTALPLLTASFVGPSFVWEVASGQMIRKLEPATWLFSPDNRFLARSAQTLQILDLYSGRIVRDCKANGNGFGNVVFSPNSKILAASCSDTTILVWPTANSAAKAPQPMDEKTLADILAKGEAPEAYDTLGRMIADPKRAPAFLESSVQAVPKIVNLRSSS